MLLRRCIRSSTPAPACSRPLPAHRLRAPGPLCKLFPQGPSAAKMGANDDGGGGGGEEKEKGLGEGLDRAAAPSKDKAPDEAPSAALLDSLASFEGFVVEEVLNVNDMNKVAAVVGSFPGFPGRAVVRLARQPFDRARLAAPGSVGEEKGEEEEEKEEAKGTEGERAPKVPKRAEAAEPGLLGASLRLSKTLRNDVYGTYGGSFSPKAPLLEAAGAGVAVDVTYPATDRHVAKQRAPRRVALWETRELYERVTLPLVEAAPASRVAWVDNILEGRAEADRVMARGGGEKVGGGEKGGEKGGGGGEGEEKDGGWVLLPDMKWDHRRAAAALAELRKLEEEGTATAETLAAASDRAKSARDSFYAQLIFRDRGLRSLRDIDGASAPRVAAAVAAAVAFVKSEYGIPRSSLRAFFHYHPSYWRLHVHLVGPQAFPDDGAGRAHLVEDVLEAVRAEPRWWRERALGVRSFRGDELAEALIAVGGEQQ